MAGHEAEQALEDGEGQESLACCIPWGHKESDLTLGLNNNSNSERFHLEVDFWEVCQKCQKILRYLVN